MVPLENTGFFFFVTLPKLPQKDNLKDQSIVAD